MAGNVVGGIEWCRVEGYGLLPVSDTARVSVNRETATITRGATGEVEVALSPMPEFIEVNVIDRPEFDLEAMVNDRTGLTVTIKTKSGIRRTLSNAVVDADVDLDELTGKSSALKFTGGPMSTRRP